MWNLRNDDNTFKTYWNDCVSFMCFQGFRAARILAHCIKNNVKPNIFCGDGSITSIQPSVFGLASSLILMIHHHKHYIRSRPISAACTTVDYSVVWGDSLHENCYTVHKDKHTERFLNLNCALDCFLSSYLPRAPHFVLSKSTKPALYLTRK